jgi:hypothetical protein
MSDATVPLRAGTMDQQASGLARWDRLALRAASSHHFNFQRQSTTKYRRLSVPTLDVHFAGATGCASRYSHRDLVKPTMLPEINVAFKAQQSVTRLRISFEIENSSFTSCLGRAALILRNNASPTEAFATAANVNDQSIVRRAPSTLDRACFNCARRNGIE